MRDAGTIAKSCENALEGIPGMKWEGAMYEETDAEDGTVTKDGFWITVDGRTYQVSVEESSDSRARRGG